MRSKILKKVLEETSLDTAIFVKKYGDIVVRIQDLLKEKGLKQKDLANALGKKESEISRWLNGEHNLTLRSIAKIEAELGETILYVPRRVAFTNTKKASAHFTVLKNDRAKGIGSFDKYISRKSRTLQIKLA